MDIKGNAGQLLCVVVHLELEHNKLHVRSRPKLLFSSSSLPNIPLTASLFCCSARRLEWIVSLERYFSLNSALWYRLPVGLWSLEKVLWNIWPCAGHMRIEQSRHLDLPLPGEWKSCDFAAPLKSYWQYLEWSDVEAKEVYYSKKPSSWNQILYLERDTGK